MNKGELVERIAKDAKLSKTQATAQGPLSRCPLNYLIAAMIPESITTLTRYGIRYA